MDEKDKAQAGLLGCGVEPGQRYRHYKGGLYEVIAIGIKEDTLEPMVAYRSELKGTTWFRTLENFTERPMVGGVLLDESRFRLVEG